MVENPVPLADPKPFWANPLPTAPPELLASSVSTSEDPEADNRLPVEEASAEPENSPKPFSNPSAPENAEKSLVLPPATIPTDEDPPSPLPLAVVSDVDEEPPAVPEPSASNDPAPVDWPCPMANAVFPAFVAVELPKAKAAPFPVLEPDNLVEVKRLLPLAEAVEEELLEAVPWKSLRLPPTRPSPNFRWPLCFPKSDPST